MDDREELKQAISELRSCGETLITVALRFEQIFDPQNATATESAAPVPETPAPEPSEPEPTFEEVRAFLSARSCNGATAEIKALLLKHGANRLSEIHPSEYRALMKEAEALGNG